VSEWIAPDDRRVGILGGTFDPVHFGHLVIAEQVREALQLDRVLFVPAARPPHKLNVPVTPAADRAAMVELAIAGNPAFAVCRIEMERSGPSYTVETLETLADEGRRAGIMRKLFFILSSEAAAALPTWRAPARILELAELAVVARPGFATQDAEEAIRAEIGPTDRVLAIDTVPVAHSSSDVRARAAAGHSIRYLVPPAVESYIRDHRLYLSTNPVRTA
jgi:nicotinate-nucleotide adenylyltransferase